LIGVALYIGLEDLDELFHDCAWVIALLTLDRVLDVDAVRFDAGTYDEGRKHGDASRDREPGGPEREVCAAVEERKRLTVQTLRNLSREQDGATFP